jgi:hypothetical protein
MEKGGVAVDAIIARRPGSAIRSRYANASALYFSARRIDTLAQVGGLAGPALAVARRADGVIANQPSDGRVAIDELFKLEQPGFINRLFPEERAALGTIWTLMQTVGTAATAARAPMLRCARALPGSRRCSGQNSRVWTGPRCCSACGVWTRSPAVAAADGCASSP